MGWRLVGRFSIWNINECQSRPNRFILCCPVHQKTLYYWLNGDRLGKVVVPNLGLEQPKSFASMPQSHGHNHSEMRENHMATSSPCWNTYSCYNICLRHNNPWKNKFLFRNSSLWHSNGKVWRGLWRKNILTFLKMSQVSFQQSQNKKIPSFPLCESFLLSFTLI